MKKKSARIILIAAVLFACWLQFPVGMHIKKVIPGVEATCAKTGLTEGKQCSLCGKILVAQREIPVTGQHLYANDFDTSCDQCPYTREVNSIFAYINHRVVLNDENQSHNDWRVTVFALGDKTADDPCDEVALTAIDSNAKTYWGISEINRILLDDPGNYVLLLKYNVGRSAAIKVPLSVVVTAETVLIVDGDNSVEVIDGDASNKNHTLTVYELGTETVENPEDEAQVQKAALDSQTYTGKTAINELVITKSGNYVFFLHYETGDGTRKTIVLSSKLTNSRPVLRVDEENRLVVTCEDDSVNHFRAYVYYLDEQTVTDIYDESALKKFAGEPTVYWNPEKNYKAVLREPGNYVIHLYYNVGTGPKETVATTVTIANQENNDSP